MNYKYIILNNETTFYKLFEDGTVINEKTNNTYTGTIRGGYRYFDFRWKNKKYSKSQHRLLAEYFLENPYNYECVHHIDGNRLNNSLDNLKWVSYSENNTYKKAPSVDHNDYNEYDINEEEWITLKDTKYMISNLGRVKNAEQNKILKGKITSTGYREYCLTINHKKRSYLGHRLVYEAWNGKIQGVINHIDGNKLNNRITNLEDVSSSENDLKAIYETKTHQFKKTAQYDEEWNLIQVFENNADAARHMGVKPQSIQIAIQKGNKSCGYYWKNLE